MRDLDGSPRAFKERSPRKAFDGTLLGGDRAAATAAVSFLDDVTHSGADRA